VSHTASARAGLQLLVVVMLFVILFMTLVIKYFSVNCEVLKSVSQCDPAAEQTM
jgi:hypothetical protein